VSTVGVIVNPHAGKDIRRLVSGASHTADTVKIGILRRVIAGAAESGAERIVLGADAAGLGALAADGLGAPVEILPGPMTGSHFDTVAAATEMWKAEAGAVVVLGGDGTCRDVATGWPDAPIIAVSTGTNNVFPTALDGTSAGVAAALVAADVVPLEAAANTAERISVHVDRPSAGAVVVETALVEVALVDASFAGARAVTDPGSIRWVVACIADPAATGLASLAGRVRPVGRDDPGGVLIRLGPGGRRVRVPLTPGTFETLDVASVETVEPSSPVILPGGGMLAYDGERTTPVPTGASVTVSIERAGPRVIDVGRVLARAADRRHFDLRGDGDGC
jgi:predicted polyphosphate/ATP-dependent NAD kinase